MLNQNKAYPFWNLINSKWLILAISLVLTIYCSYRAALISISFDEMVSYQRLKYLSWDTIGDTTNQHLLNSVLMNYSITYFPLSEFSLRLPNLLGLLLFLLFAYKICAILNPKRVLIPFVLLTTVPFLLDFFSLARGYGLGMGFGLGSIYFLLRYLKKRFLLTGVMSLSFGILAVLSNYTYLNVYIAVAFLLIISVLIEFKSIRQKLVAIGLFCGISGVFVLSISRILFHLKDIGELYYGGPNGFFSDTILSLGRCLAYHKGNVLFFQLIFFLLFFLASILAIINTRKGFKRRIITPRIGLSLLFLLLIIAPILEFWIFKTSFPIERTALIYYISPILVLISFYSEKWLVLNRAVQLIFLFSIIHFISCINFRSSYSYRFDSGSKEVAEFLKPKENQTSKPLTLGINYIYNPSFHFYLQIMKFRHFQVEKIDHCWDYAFDIEELNPSYYSVSDPGKTSLSKAELESIFENDYDYYFLHDFFIKELDRHQMHYEDVLNLDYANAHLIQILE